MKLFVCLHNQLGAISRLRYLSESASHLLSLLVSESIFQLPLPALEFIYLFLVGLLCLGGPGSRTLPREQPVPAGLSAVPRAHGPGGSRGALGAIADPPRAARQGQGEGRAAGGPGGTLQSCLSPWMSSLLALPEEAATTCVRRGWEEAREGSPGASLPDGGPRYGFERCFYKASPNPMGPISSPRLGRSAE